MANALTASFPEIWAKEQQEVFYKQNVAMAVSDVSYKSQMSRGDVLNRPYRSTITAQSYSRGTAITIDDLTDTQESMTINAEFATGFYVDNFDQIQSNYDVAANYGRDAGVVLSNKVDAYTFGDYASAASTVDDGDIGGTSGNAIALTTSNVLAVISAAKKKLQKLSIPMDNLFGLISPEFEEILIQYGAGRDTQMGDAANKNGFLFHFYGFALHRTNQLSGSALLAMATDVTAGDTITIEGVVLTAAASPAAAGDFDVTGTADGTRAVIASLINNPRTTNVTQIALSEANARIFDALTATNDDTANTLAVVAKGVGVLNVSETLTDGTDAWTATKSVQHNLFGRKGAFTLVVQSAPSVEVRPVQDKLGKNLLNGVLFGHKVYVDGGKQLVDVQIKSSTFS